MQGHKATQSSSADSHRVRVQRWSLSKANQPFSRQVRDRELLSHHARRNRIDFFRGSPKKGNPTPGGGSLWLCLCALPLGLCLASFEASAPVAGTRVSLCCGSLPGPWSLERPGTFFNGWRLGAGKVASVCPRRDTLSPRSRRDDRSMD